MLLVGCQKVERLIDPGYVSSPFQFHKETAEWLNSCEEQIEPPFQAIYDFDLLKKKYLKDKAYYDSVYN